MLAGTEEDYDAVVLVVDDHPMMRRVMVRALRGAGYICHAAGSGTEALAALDERHFDAVVSDIKLPGCSGLELMAATRSEDAPPFVLVTGEPSLGSAVKGLQLSAVNYIAKPFRMPELVRSVAQAVSIGRDRKLLQKMRDEASAVGGQVDPRSEASTPANGPARKTSEREVSARRDVSAILSQREYEVVACISEGLSTEESAERLSVSKNTIRNHLARIYKKLGVHSRAGLLSVVYGRKIA